MALIKCPECGKEVSENAASCPNCGRPIKATMTINEDGSQTSVRRLWIIILIAVILIIGLIILRNKVEDAQLTPEEARELLEKQSEAHKKKLEEENQRARELIDIIQR